MIVTVVVRRFYTHNAKTVTRKVRVAVMSETDVMMADASARKVVRRKLLSNGSVVESIDHTIIHG